MHSKSYPIETSTQTLVGINRRQTPILLRLSKRNEMRVFLNLCAVKECFFSAFLSAFQFVMHYLAVLLGLGDSVVFQASLVPRQKKCSLISQATHTAFSHK